MIGSDQTDRSKKTPTWITVGVLRVRGGAPGPTALFDVPGVHVLAVEREPDRLVLTMETDAAVAGCPSCGVVAVGHGRRVHEVADAPSSGRHAGAVAPAGLALPGPGLPPVGTFFEQRPMLEAQGLLRE